jgi:hypothetical protein
VKGVGATAGDGVHPTAREAAETHVVGSHDQLNLLDRVEGDRVRAGLPAGRPRAREAEEVVVHGAVDLDVVDGSSAGDGDPALAGVGVEVGESRA